MPIQAIKITGLSLRDRATPANTVDCCYFDVEIAGVIKLEGCLLKRTARGGFIASPPRLASDRSAVVIMDNSLQHAMTDAARKAYIAMGGEFGVYAGQERAAATNEALEHGSTLSDILPPVDREESR